MTHQFPFDINAAESYIRMNHPEVIFDSITPTLQDGAGYLFKSGNLVVFRLPLLNRRRVRSEQIPSRWSAFTDSELFSLYNALFAFDDGSEDLAFMQIQMRDEIVSRSEREMKDGSSAEIAEKVLQNLRVKVAGR